MAKGMPLPGRAAPLMPAPPPDDAADESGETCHITAEQLAELNETGTTTSDDGETITADIGDESKAPDEAAEGAGE